VPDAITPEVLAAARAGDGDAFAVIWRELAPTVTGYLTARGVADPEALTSDVFLAVLPRLRSLHGGVGGLRTFVFSVAHARAVDDIRRRARRPDPVEFDPRAHDGVTGSAEATALDNVATDRVCALLRRLAPDHREVLALRIVADLALDQTAAIMRRSEGAVKQLQRRALAALRAEIDADSFAAVAVEAR
jgi:RNA polymerase sigma factor (sigma-70 family)